MTTCPHKWFFASWDSNREAVDQRFPGGWLVTCGHCGVGIAGCNAFAEGAARVVWRNERAFFGSFGY